MPKSEMFDGDVRIRTVGLIAGTTLWWVQYSDGFHKDRKFGLALTRAAAVKRAAIEAERIRFFAGGTHRPVNAETSSKIDLHEPRSSK